MQMAALADNTGSNIIISRQ